MKSSNPSGFEEKTSGAHPTFWLESVTPKKYSPLKEDLATEVVIVGGGLAGISVAYCLSKAGKKSCSRRRWIYSQRRNWKNNCSPGQRTR